MALFELVEQHVVLRPNESNPGSVKISLFSLGNIIAHPEMRQPGVFPHGRAMEICTALQQHFSPNDVVHKYAHRVMLKMTQG